VTRRNLLAATVVVAATSLSACATFTDNTNAARVGETELAVDDLGAVIGAAGAEDGSVVRAQLTKWIRVNLLESRTSLADSERLTAENLDSRLDSAFSDLIASNVPAAEPMYEQGPSASGVVCLGAIPVESVEVGVEVLDAIDGGVSFADAAAQYSTDQGLAANGGVVLAESGDECLPTAGINPDLAAALDGIPVGASTSVSLGQVVAIVRVRPWSELTAAGQDLVARQTLPDEFILQLVSEADVYVDPRYGHWNADTGTVDAMGA
jgi:hypothetical protein